MATHFQKGERVIRSSEKGGRFEPHVGIVQMVAPGKVYVRYHLGYAKWEKVEDLERAEP